MLDYTKAAVETIKKDFERLAFICGILTQMVYIAYMIYSIVTEKGIFYINLALLVLSCAYFSFYLYANAQELKKKIKKRAARIFKRCKQLIKIFNLLVLIYGIWGATKNASPFTVLLLVFMVVGLLLDILLEIILRFFINRANLIMEGIKADYGTVTKPARSVGNFFKKITGKEIPQENPTPQREFLEGIVEEKREERSAQKLEKKYLKAQEKAKKRAQSKNKTKKNPSQEEIAFAAKKQKKGQ